MCIQVEGRDIQVALQCKQVGQADQLKRSPDQPVQQGTGTAAQELNKIGLKKVGTVQNVKDKTCWSPRDPELKRPGTRFVHRTQFSDPNNNIASLKFNNAYISI